MSREPGLKIANPAWVGSSLTCKHCSADAASSRGGTSTQTEYATAELACSSRKRRSSAACCGRMRSPASSQRTQFPVTNLQAVIACGGEVVFPGRAVDRGAKLGGQFRRPIRGAGVQDHDFIGDLADAFDRFGQHLLLVADDHRYGEAGPRQRFCEDFHMPSLAILRLANKSIRRPATGSEGMQFLRSP